MKDYSKANNIENSPFKDRYSMVMNWCLRAFQKIEGMEDINVEHWTLADFVEEGKIQIEQYNYNEELYEIWRNFLDNYEGYLLSWYPDVVCNFEHKLN